MATITNQATLNYNNMVLASNVTTGQLNQALTVTKSAVDNGYARGNNVTYILNLVNSGTTAYTNLTISDDLGTYTVGTNTVTPLTYVDGTAQYYINGEAQAAPTVKEGPPLSITGINVPAGGNTVIIYQAMANQYASPEANGLVTNTATVSGTGLTDDITAENEIGAEGEPDLSIIKSMSPQNITPGGQVTYTFLITNTGNAAVLAADDVTVSDTFDPILSNLAVTFDGTTWAETTNYTYDTTTGLFTTVAGEITVPAATFSQSSDGVWTITPGVSTLTVTGTV